MPEGAKLTESQYASYKAGNLYVNVAQRQESRRRGPRTTQGKLMQRSAPRAARSVAQVRSELLLASPISCPARKACAYSVRRASLGLQWRTEENGTEVVYDKEPRVDLWRRFKVDALSLLPIESRL